MRTFVRRRTWGPIALDHQPSVNTVAEYQANRRALRAMGRTTVVRTMTDDARTLLERMRAAIASPTTGAYAISKLESIATYLEDNGTISERQRAFAESLLANANGSQERQTIDLGNFGPMVAIFDRARAAPGPAPKVSLNATGIGEIELSLAGDRARVPGSINVATPGGYGNSTWFGRITRDGRFEVAGRTPTPPSVLAMLQAFATSPLDTVRAYGHLTGRCALCRHKLTTAKSIAAGVGPVCASRYLGERV